MSYNVDEVRKIALQLARKAQEDESFREQLEKDPQRILKAAGIPEDALSDILRETELADVIGYAKPQCIGSFCFIDTCFITL
jgi:hypothetical protein